MECVVSEEFFLCVQATCKKLIMFTKPTYLAFRLAIWLIAATASNQVFATDSGVTASGISFVSGGVSAEELAALNKDRTRFSFWLVTAALGSGAYLADAIVKITALTGDNVILEHKMDGPWLFVALPKGRYAVSATYSAGRNGSAQTLTTLITIGNGNQKKSVLYFDTGDKVGDSSSR